MLNHTNKTDTKAALVAALEIIKIAYQYVAANPAGMSSGELYMRLAAPLNWQDDRTYQSLLGLMVRSKMVKDSGHWLTALPLE
jgi:hypothetical protein